MKSKQTIAGWANYPQLEAQVLEPKDRIGLRNFVLENEQIIARGNGKSYGDASLAPTVLSMLQLKRVLAFDEREGIIEAEAGVLLRDLLQIIVPAGWFFHVTPGIKAITLGGAIASDVHGKNHPNAGCFSQYLISFELMTASGEIKICSRNENAALFWQTCGGMGWTGVVLSVRFKLMKITSTSMRQQIFQANNLDEIFAAFEDNMNWPYAAGWVDCTSAQWRGAVLFAEHLEKEPAGESLVFLEEKKRRVPFFAPSWMLNPWSIRAHNHFYFNKNKTAEKLVSLDKYFYPLDALENWNRFYGRRGFVQYQFCLPEANAKTGIRQALQIIRESAEVPFLTVLKRHGERPSEAIHSFPIRGYSLALDFPRTRGIFELVKKLDALVWTLGGKIYLTKDACSAPYMGRINPDDFGASKFSSLLRERIANGVHTGF